MSAAAQPASASSPEAPSAPAALRDPASHLRLWSVVVLGLSFDLWSKEWAFQTLRQTGYRQLIPNVLEFRTTLNPGALFGIGAGHTELFLIASVLALVLVIWMFAQSPPRHWFTHIALGAILAGALGNMYDRAFINLVRLPVAGGGVRYYLPATTGGDGGLVLHEFPPGPDGPVRGVPAEVAGELERPIGYVRDFIKIPTRWFRGQDIWPWVFNVADMLLVGGVGILALRLFRDRRAPESEARTATKLDAATDKT